MVVGYIAYYTFGGKAPEKIITDACGRPILFGSEEDIKKIKMATRSVPVVRVK